MMWRVAILSAASLALLGCRSDPNVPILERELRLQEDKIYQLEGQLAEHRAALEACRRQAGAPGVCPAPGRAPAEGQTGPALTPTGPPEPVTPQPPIVELPSQPQSQLPETLRPKATPPAAEEPKVEPSAPQPSAPQPSAPPPSAPPPAAPAGSEPARPHGSAGRTRAKPVSRPAPTPARPLAASARNPSSTPVPAVASGRVERIVLNPSLSGGLNADGKPGDEGLTLLIEPQDSHGRTLARAAPVSIVVLDRQARGEAARVARWDFSAEQVAKRLRRTSVGSGIYLELPWPLQAPAHGELQVFVRYTPDEGRRLEAEMPLAIELAGQPKQWTAAQPGSKRGRVATQTQPEPSPVAAKPVAAKPAPVVEVAPSPPLEAKRESRPADQQPVSRPQVRRPVWSPNR